MKMNNLHLIYTVFTGLGIYGGYRGDQWLQKRIKIFFQNTFKSLLAQESHQFIHWMSFRPEERYNTYVLNLAETLKDIGYPFIMTFDGPMIWDDKLSSNLNIF